MNEVKGFIVGFKGTGKSWYPRWICKNCGLKKVISNIMCSRCGNKNPFVPYEATVMEKKNKS